MANPWDNDPIVSASPRTIPIGAPNPKYPYEGPQAAATLNQTGTTTAHTAAEIPGVVAKGQVDTATIPAQIRKARAEADSAESDAATKATKAEEATRTLSLLDPAAVVQASKADQYQGALRAIQQAQSDTNGWSTGGTGDFMRNHVPSFLTSGTSVARLPHDLDAIRTNLALNTMNNMRQESLNGSNAMRTTQYEFQQFGNALASLHPEDGKDRMQANLGFVGDHFKKLYALSNGLDPELMSVTPEQARRGLAVGQQNLAQHIAGMPPAQQQAAIAAYKQTPAYRTAQFILQQAQGKDGPQTIDFADLPH